MQWNMQWKKREVISDHFLMLWFEEDCFNFSGYGRGGGRGARVLNPADKKVTKIPERTERDRVGDLGIIPEEEKKFPISSSLDIGQSSAFLSDLSPINWLPLSLTSRLTDCCLIDLIDATLACEDANSKLVDFVTVANIDEEATVWCRFGRWGLVINNFCSDFEHKVWSRFWSWSSGNILKLEFG